MLCLCGEKYYHKNTAMSGESGSEGVGRSTEKFIVERLSC